MVVVHNSLQIRFVTNELQFQIIVQIILIQGGLIFLPWIFLPLVGSFCYTVGNPKWQKDSTPLYITGVSYS